MIVNTKVKYPNITIDLSNQDGNAFAIIGTCTLALKRNGLRDQVKPFIAEATSGDYDKVLRTVLAWFSVEVNVDEVDTATNCNWCEETHEDCECEG